MRLQDDLDFTTLNWVKHELDETLKEARQALEVFVEDPEDSSQMRFCATYLHQVHGTLRMVELYGAALVVEEMERVALGLIDESIGKSDDAYSVLMRGIVQLPDYLERLQSGHRDIPIVLLPLLNDLRATRGEKLLSENVLFRPDLDVDLPQSAAGPAAPVPQDKLQAAVARLRMAFEFGLLKWFRDEDADEILTRLITIADRLRSVTSEQQARRLWWVAGGVLEALLVRGLDPSVSVKLLFGRVDREIKRLHDGGEDSFRDSPPDELVRSLLYYVAHSQATSRRVTELRETFQLNDLLPDASEIEHAKGALAGHNRQLLDTVSSAIKEDLLRVKDALDLHLRRDEAGAADMEPLSETLDGVADTLGMLGLGVPRKVVLEQRAAIEDMIAGNRPDDEDSLLDIAGALLYVESSLDDHIEALGAPAQSDQMVIAPMIDDDGELTEDGRAAVVGGVDSELPQSEVRRILDALIKEAHTNINQAKQEIVAFIEAPWDHSRIVETPRLLEEILGALKMLDLGEPAEVVSGILAYVEDELLGKKEVPTAEELDTLADTVASIEYYLEGVREHRPGRTRVLEVARQSVERLRAGNVGGQELQLDTEQRERLESDELGAVDLPLSEDDLAIDGSADQDDTQDDQEVSAAASEAQDDHEVTSTDSDEVADFEAPSEDELAGFDWPPQDDSDQSSGSDADELVADEQVTGEFEIEQTSEQAAEQAASSERQRIHDLSNDIDDDIREVYVEEVGEELGNLNELYPKWKADPEDTNTLTTIRRIFHTLKGSGRLVGAMEIGEFSWRIENMLNHILEETVQPGAPVMALMDHVMTALPQLLANLEDENQTPTADIAGIMGVADRITYGEEAYLESAEDADSEQAAEAVSEDSAQSGAAEAKDDEVEDDEIDAWVESGEEIEVFGEALDIDDDLEVPAEEGPDELDETLSVVDMDLGDESLETMEFETGSSDEPVEGDAIETDEGIEVSADSDSPTADGESEPADEWDLGDLNIDFASLDDEPEAEQSEDHAALEASGSLSDLDEDLSGQDDHVEQEGQAEQEVDELSDTPDELEDSASLTADLIAEAEDLLPSLDVLDESSDAIGEEQHEGEPADADSADEWEIDLSADDEATAAAFTEESDQAEQEASSESTEDDWQSAAEGSDEFDMDASGPGADLDPVLLEIFQAEVNSHIGGVRSYLDEVANADAPVPVTDDLLRAVHTLNGAAAMVNASFVSDVTAPLEGYVKKLKLLGASPSGEGVVALGASATVIGALARAIGSDTAMLPDTAGLVSNLDRLRDELPEPGEGASIFGIETSDEDLAEDHQGDDSAVAEDVAENESVESDTSEQEMPSAEDSEETTDAELSEDSDGQASAGIFEAASYEQATGELDHAPDEEGIEVGEVESIDGIPDAWLGADDDSDDAQDSETQDDEADHEAATDLADADETIPQEVHSSDSESEDDVEGAEAPLDEIELSSDQDTDEDSDQDLGEPESDVPEPDVDPMFVEVDDELLDIFLQEGHEILDEADSRMATWREQPDSMEMIAGLQRDLHTLKGGARMAGLSPIGDLSHAMESVFTEVAEENLDVNRTMIEVLEHAFDRLQGMLEKVARRESIDLPKAAMMELEGLLPSGVHAELDDEGRERPKQQADVIAFPQVRPGPDTEDSEAQAQPLRAQEIIRVRSDLLDNLVNYAGEVSIYRSRLEQQVGNFRFNLTEFEQTVTRLREQLRKLEIETEAQILSRFQREAEEEGEDFDPLELDRFSQIQQLSRALAESVSDLVSLQEMLDDITSQSETLLLQQSRVSSDLQEGLMRTRMVPFESLVPRLRRILRQACQELGKRAQLRVEGAQGEMDRNVLERITAPLEHMLRNAVAHGVESPEQRESQGKPADGEIRIEVSREATEVVLNITDDGAGIDLDAVRDRALERGLLIEGAEFTDRDLLGFILETGFSTADTVTKLAGRGVGLDVVNSEIKQLGGSLDIDTHSGKGSNFEVRLPFTLAVTHAIMVRIGDSHFAVPLSGIQSVVRLSQDEFDERVSSGNPIYQFAGLEHQIMDLNVLLGLESQHVTEDDQVPLLMVRVGDRRAAVRVDAVLDAREIVVKSVGPQVSTVPGIFGATILGDGSVVLILDLSPLVRRGAALQLQLDTEVTPFVPEAVVEEERMPMVMVVDDSITMRKVTSRILERNEMEVVTAKDGVDALTQLQERVPDVMLLDIEMPRMDGYELATIMRNDTRLAAIPIIMITSRTGEKHRQRAFDIGVERYLGKPYQEGDLLSNINDMLERESGDTD